MSIFLLLLYNYSDDRVSAIEGGNRREDDVLGTVVNRAFIDILTGVS